LGQSTGIDEIYISVKILYLALKLWAPQALGGLGALEWAWQIYLGVKVGVANFF